MARKATSARSQYGFSAQDLGRTVARHDPCHPADEVASTEPALVLDDQASAWARRHFRKVIDVLPALRTEASRFAAGHGIPGTRHRARWCAPCRNDAPQQIGQGVSPLVDR